MILSSNRADEGTQTPSQFHKVLGAVQLLLILLLAAVIGTYIAAMMRAELCVELRIGSEVYGCVASPEVMHTAAARFNALRAASGGDGVSIEPSYVFVDRLRAGEELMDEDDCFALLANYSNLHYLNAYSVSVDGTHLATLATREEADEVVDRFDLLLRRAALENDGSLASVSAAGVFSVTETVCERSAVSSEEEVLRQLSRFFGEEEDEEEAPEAESGENDVSSSRYSAFSDERTCQRAGEMGFELLRRTSVTGQTTEEIEKKLSSIDIDALNVTTVREVRQTVIIPFKSTTKKSSSYYVGTTKVKTVGEDGLGEEIWRVEYVAGKEVSRVKVSECVLTPAVDEVVIVGTKEYPKPVPTGSYIWPLPTKWKQITSPYGWRPDPFTGERRFHKGIDIYAEKDTDVLAADGGTVTYTGYDSSRGLYIVVDVGNGLEFYYEHLHKSLVSKGDKVYQGQVIGKVGKSGRATGYHLHFEVHKKGEPVNPLKYLKKP